MRDLQVSPVVEEARDDRQPKENVPEDDRVNRKLLVDCVALGRERLTWMRICTPVKFNPFWNSTMLANGLSSKSVIMASGYEYPIAYLSLSS